MNQSCKCKCASPEVCILNHIKNLDIHVTLEDKQRWNNAAQKSSGKDIDIDKYSTTEEVKQLIKDYVDNQGFITDIPEYYETEEEVLLLLDTTLQNYTKREALDEILIQYMPLAQFQEFEQQLYQYLQQLKEDILESSKYVTQITFNEDTRMFHLTRSDGEILSVEIPGGGGGGGDTPISYMQYNASAYVNVTNGISVNTPIGGSYDFNTYSLIPPHDPEDTSGTITWKGSMSGMTVDENHSIYVSNRTFNSDPNAPTTTWSSPILFSGSIKTETNTETYEYYSTEVSRVFIVYHTGEIKEIQDPTTGEYSYKSTPPKEVYAAPQGGQYDKSQDQLTTMPHTYGYDSDLWSLTLPEPGEYTIPNHNESEQQQTITKSIYFSIGQVSESSIEWSQPAIYGTDYVAIASNMKFIAIDYALLAENITLTSTDLNVVAKNVVLNQDQLRIIADNVNIDSSLTTFRGEVDATKFTVFKDNAYWTKDSVSGKVLKNTDIDQKLFQIALNNDGQTTHDSESDDNDVLMLIYNPGVLTGHSAGTEEHGQGEKGELAGNNVEFIINPKRLSYNRFLSYYCHVDTEYWDGNSDLLEEAIGKRGDVNQSIIYEKHANGWVKSLSINNCLWNTFPESLYLDKIQNDVVILPDPKTYRGATIKGTIDTCFSLRRNNADTSEQSTRPFDGYHPEINIADTGNTSQVNAQDVNICSNDAQAIECVINDQLCNLYNMYWKDEHQYNPGTGNVQITWNYLYQNGLPRLTIADNSAFPFVRINAYSDEELVEKDILNYRSNGIISLNRNFYTDWASVAYHILAQQGGTTRQQQLCRAATPFDFEDWYDTSYKVDYSKWKSHMDLIYDGNYDDSPQTPVLTNKLSILPSPTGIFKIAHGMPLTFDAVAVEVSVKNVPIESNGQIVNDVDGNFYYWDIRTQDFHVYYDVEYTKTVGNSTFNGVNSVMPILPIDEVDLDGVSSFLAYGPTEDSQARCYQSGIAVTQLQPFLRLVIDLYDFNFNSGSLDTNDSLKTLFSSMNIHSGDSKYPTVVTEQNNV